MYNKGDTMRLLLVEDEIFLANSVTKKLKNANIDVTSIYNGEDALEEILYNQYDIVILDIMLPGLDGLSIIKKVREKENTIPIILTSAKGETEDKVRGLEIGADDYLSKPYEFDELLARINTCLRRSSNTSFKLDDATFANLTYDRNSLEISTTNQSMTLTLKEFNLLVYLINSTPMVVSKDQIIDQIWGYDNDVLHNQIEVYISYLRKKLKLIDATCEIKTIRGLGYKIEEINV